MVVMVLKSKKGLMDSDNHAPPTTGSYPYSPPYGLFKPGQIGFPALAATYVDPVFGTTIRRLTANDPTAIDGGGSSDIYVKKGWWTADSAYFITQIEGSLMKAINATTGATKPLTNPGGASRPDASCSPSDPDAFYYYSGTEIKQQSISTGTITTLKNFGATVGPLGGSQDWIDNSGRYMLVNLGSPSMRVWDRQLDVLYTGAITGSLGSSGWLGSMAPDATYVVVVDGATKMRHAINHGTQTLTASPTTFFTGGGNHGDLVCPTDGNLYWIAVNNDGNPAFMYRVNVATGAVTTFFTFNVDAYWTAGPNHISGIRSGALRDWVACSSDTQGGPTAADDDFDGADPVATWGRMQNEIYMLNVLTGAIRRLAHHRSREPLANYYHQPRVCASWDGSKIAWASNMGYESSPLGYADIWSCVT